MFNENLRNTLVLSRKKLQYQITKKKRKKKILKEEEKIDYFEWFKGQMKVSYAYKKIKLYF